MSFNTKKYWKQFFEDELGPLPELLYAQVSDCQPAKFVTPSFCCVLVQWMLLNCATAAWLQSRSSHRDV